MIGIFFDALDELHHMQSLGKIVQREPAVGSKMWCVFLSRFLSSFEWDILWTAIVSLVMGRFSFCSESFFSEVIALSESLDSSYFRRIDGATLFEKLRSKIAKSPKIGR